MIPLTKKAVLPENHTLVNKVGRYLFTEYKGALHLVGLNSIVNLNDLPIMSVDIMPADSHFLFKDGLPLDWDLHKGVVYYYCSFNNRSFLFDTYDEADTFIYTIVNHKAQSLLTRSK